MRECPMCGGRAETIYSLQRTPRIKCHECGFSTRYDHNAETLWDKRAVPMRYMPCPLCNGYYTAELVHTGLGYSVKCDQCGCMTDVYPSYDDARNAWNRRRDNE